MEGITINTKEKTKKNLLWDFSPKSHIVEAYRTLLTNIQFSTPESPPKTLLITSPGRGEGKTTTISNLAITLSSEGAKTLILDTDLRRPALHTTFSIRRAPGLTDFLAGLGKFQEIFIKVSENLFLLPSGPLPPNPPLLLRSEKMKELIKEAKRRFDVLLFDSPPILPVADSVILAKEVDGVLIVVRSGYTPREALGNAKQILDGIKAKILGVVVNRHEMDGRSYYHYQSEE
jgi:capsular exopolysaccharide synthesis family protein